MGPRAWGTAAAMALLALLTGGCGPDRGDMERRAVDEARTAAGDVQASLQDVVHTMAGASPAQLEEALEQSLEDSTVVTWHGAGATTDGSTTWRVGVVGSVSEAEVPSYAHAYARLCFDAVLDHGTGQIAALDADCPTDAPSPVGAVEADLEP